MLFLKNIDRVAVKISSLTDSIFPGLQEKNEKLHIFYREVLHILGSVLLILITFSFPVVLKITFVILTCYILYKEIVFDPDYYNQKTYKGIIDVVSWILPFVLYFVFF